LLRLCFSNSGDQLSINSFEWTTPTVLLQPPKLALAFFVSRLVLRFGQPLYGRLDQSAKSLETKCKTQ